MRPLLAALALLLALACPVSAASLRDCRAVCGPQVAACQVVNGLRWHRCLKFTLRRCRRQGIGACVPATFVATGDWTFSGTLALNDCNLDLAALGLGPTFATAAHVDQRGLDLTGTIGRNMEAASGTVDYSAGEWELMPPQTCSGACCTGGGIRAYAFGSSVPAAFIVTTSCNDTPCSVGYRGTAARP